MLVLNDYGIPVRLHKYGRRHRPLTLAGETDRIMERCGPAGLLACLDYVLDVSPYLAR